MDFSKLQKQNLRIQRAVGALAVLAIISIAACSSLPDPKFEKHKFPQNAFVGDVKDKPYTTLGQVRARVDYQSLDPGHEEAELCKNYYNKATRDLLKAAKEKGADAVIDVKSVVFYEDGRENTYPTPECSDDGQEGQILVQGIAVKWGKADLPVVQRPVSFIDPSSQKFRAFQLKFEEDGLDGGIRILVKPARVTLFTMDRKLLDEKAVDAKKAWLTSEFIRSSQERTILINEDQDGDVTTQLLFLHKGKLDPQVAANAKVEKNEKIVLFQGHHSAWKLTTTVPHDLVQVSTAYIPVDPKNPQGPTKSVVNYTRYHFGEMLANQDGQNLWMKFSKTEEGLWDPTQGFPAEEKFPPNTYFPK